MKITAFQFNLFGVNTYVVWDPVSYEAAIIDPGMSSELEQDTLSEFIATNSLKVTHLINTHLHIDHTLGNDFVMRKYGVNTEADIQDGPLGERRDSQAAMFHLRIPTPSPLKVDVALKNGDIIKIGNGVLRVIAVPGHSPGSIALYCPESCFVITGDALFQGSVGRTDLPGGNHAQLIDSIRIRLMKLPGDTIVYPGHGPATTIAEEQQHNPFLR